MCRNQNLNQFRFFVLGCSFLIVQTLSGQEDPSKYAFYLNLEPLDMTIIKNVEDVVSTPGNAFEYKSKLTHNASVDFMRKVGKNSALGRCFASACPFHPRPSNTGVR